MDGEYGAHRTMGRWELEGVQEGYDGWREQ